MYLCGVGAIELFVVGSNFGMTGLEKKRRSKNCRWRRKSKLVVKNNVRPSLALIICFSATNNKQLDFDFLLEP